MAKPGTPTDLRVTVEGGTVHLSWGPASGGGTATEYLIDRRGPSGTKVFEPLPASVTSLVDQVPAGEYDYLIAGKNMDGASDPPARISVTIERPPVQTNLLEFLVLAAVVLGGIAILAVLVPFPAIPQPSDSLASVSGVVGAYLVRFGVILLTAAFIPALIELLARTFEIKPKVDTSVRGTLEQTQVRMGFGELLLGIVGKLPDLLRSPAGYGVTLVLLGVVLLIGAAAGLDEAAAGAGASPTPSPIATPVETIPAATTLPTILPGVS